MAKRIEKLHPFFRWAGSKKQILSKLILFWNPGYFRYVEPFAGSASLFFAIQPRRALIADTNCHLIETYKTLKKNPRAVYTKFKKFAQNKSTYLRVRRQSVNDGSPVERAARFLYLNKLCFNGIYRTNLKGEFNVPFGTAETKNMSWENFRSSARLLKGAAFSHDDFERILERVKENDFVYLDPPYAVGTRRVFKEYGPKSFGVDDLPRLKKALERIDAIGAKFVLSYAFCSEAKAAFSAWPSKKIRIRRHIAGFAEHRRNSYELIVSNIPFPVEFE